MSRHHGMNRCEVLFTDFRHSHVVVVGHSRHSHIMMVRHGFRNR